MTVHQCAVVATDASIGNGSTIGPFCIVGMDGEGSSLQLGDHATIRSHTVIYRGVVAGARLQTGHGALIREGSLLGTEVSVGSHSIVEHHVRLGNRVRLHSGCFVPELSVLEEGAWLGPGVIVTNDRYPNRPDAKEHLEGVHIGAGAHVGAGAVLLPGISIGSDALVGAGAVVVRDVPSDATVVGNPSVVR